MSVMDIIGAGASVVAAGQAIAGTDKKGATTSVIDKASRVYSHPANKYLWDVILVLPGGKTPYAAVSDIVSSYVTADFLPNTVQSRITDIAVPWYNFIMGKNPELSSSYPVIKGYEPSEGFDVNIVENEVGQTTLSYFVKWYERQINRDGTVNEPFFYQGSAYIILKSKIDYTGLSIALPTKVFFVQGIYPIMPQKLIDLSYKKPDDVLRYTITFKYKQCTIVDLADELKTILGTVDVVNNLVSGDVTGALGSVLSIAQ